MIAQEQTRKHDCFSGDLFLQYEGVFFDAISRIQWSMSGSWH